MRLIAKQVSVLMPIVVRWLLHNLTKPSAIHSDVVGQARYWINMTIRIAGWLRVQIRARCHGEGIPSVAHRVSAGSRAQRGKAVHEESRSVSHGRERWQAQSRSELVSNLFTLEEYRLHAQARI